MTPHGFRFGTMRAASFVFATCLLGGLAPPSLAAKVDFPGFRTFIPPVHPEHLASGDFDEDGDPDVAIIGTSIGGVALMFGDGSGGLRDGMIIGPTYHPLQVLATDLDQDGHLDVIVVNFGRFEGDPGSGVPGSDSTIDVHFGDGTGGVSETINLVAGFGTAQVAIGDFNEDGLLDLAAVNFQQEISSVAILLATGPRSFVVDAWYPTFSVGTRCVATGDIDRDGHLDLAVGSFGNDDFFTFLGNGTGGFTPGPQTSRCCAVPGQVFLADFDEDGILDVLLDVSPPELRFGTGDGRFTRVRGIQGLAGHAAMYVLDFDGDGHLDIVQFYAVLYLSWLAVAFGDGQGQFPLIQRTPIGGIAAGLAVDDFNRDGEWDVAAATGRGALALSMGLGDGTFSHPPTYPVVGVPFDAAAADFNEDGILDFAVASIDQGDRITVFLGVGEGAFSPATSIRVSALFRIEAADVDGDGHSDLLVVDDIFDRLQILRGDGSGGFLEPVDIPIPSGGPKDVAVGDFNEDGIVDLAVGTSAASLILYIGDGFGGFTTGATYPLTPATQTLSLCDLNADSHLDVVVASSGGSSVPSVAFFLGDGAGSLTETTFYPSPGGPMRWVATGDLDGDGALDAAVPEIFTRNMRVLFGDGLGGIREVRTFPIGPDTSSVTIADLDEDGHLDLIVGSISTADVAIYLGDGRGDFAPRYGIGVGGAGRGAVVVDLDEDGHLDIVATNTVLLNRTFVQPEFRARTGNVNAGAGPITNVLFVNGSPGIGGSRKVYVATGEPIQVRMDAPPSMGAGPAPFALYLRIGEPSERTVRTLPFGIGMTCISTPLSGGNPLRTANNIGYPNRLGVENWPQSTIPAPSNVADRSRGLMRTGTATLQGIILDSAAPNGRAAVTNAVILKVR
jgi:hypothetical protein